MKSFYLLTMLGGLTTLFSTGLAKVEASSIPQGEPPAIINNSNTQSPSVKDRIHLWESKNKPGTEGPSKKTVQQNPTHFLQGITKKCESQAQMQELTRVETVCSAARESSNPKDFDAFYQEYLKNFKKLRLRGLEKLDMKSPCSAFAEQLSKVHPANNVPFENAMLCIAKERGVYEPGADHNKTLGTER